MLILTITGIILLDMFTCSAEGNGKVISVTNYLKTRQSEIHSSGEIYNEAVLCCSTGNCSCNSLENALSNLTSNTLINITTSVELASFEYIQGIQNVTITGHNLPTVNCGAEAGVYFVNCTNIVIQGITWIECGAKRTIIPPFIQHLANYQPGVALLNSSNITVSKCQFSQSTGHGLLMVNVSGHVSIDNSLFKEGSTMGNGSAIYYSTKPDHYQMQHKVTIANCSFTNNTGSSTVYVESKNGENYLLLINCSFTRNYGVPLYAVKTNICLNGTILFERNTAVKGGGIYASDSSIHTIVNSRVVFRGNKAKLDGGAIFLRKGSDILFTENTTVTFVNNRAVSNGGAIFAEGRLDKGTSCGVTFRGSSVTFLTNTAIKKGGAVMLRGYTDSCYLEFAKNCTVNFTKNIGSNGGAVYCISFQMKFKYNSLLLFRNNKASRESGREENGGAVYSLQCDINFESNHKIQFDHNQAEGSGGGIYSRRSSVLFKNNSLTTFSDNKAYYGGAICHEHLDPQFSYLFKLYKHTDSIFQFELEGFEQISNTVHKIILVDRYQNNLLFEGELGTKITFDANSAISNGGAISIKGSYCIFTDSISAKFINCSSKNGGAVHSYNTSFLFFEKNCSATLSNNAVSLLGGAFYASQLSGIVITGSSSVKFYSNKAGKNGGAIWTGNYSSIMFKENSTITFAGNTAKRNGGTLFTDTSYLIYMNHSKVLHHHSVSQEGGALYSINASAVIFTDHTSVSFYKNNVSKNGGALYAYENCSIALKRNSSIKFNSNAAEANGGAAYFDAKTNVIFNETTSSSFTGNSAYDGGAIFVSNSIITLAENCSVNLHNNSAQLNGGAMSFGDHYKVKFTNECKVVYSNNTADSHGGAIYAKMTLSNQLTVQSNNIDFQNNHARVVGDSMYINVFSECNKTCLSNHIIVNTTKTSQSQLINHILSSPSKLVLNYPAQCISFDQHGVCTIYYIDHIMLGQVITIDGCVLDYYDRIGNIEQFIINTDPHKDYNINNGFQHILLSCNAAHETKVLGAEVETNFNYSVSLTLYSVQKVHYKTFSVSVILELTPCHPGFLYDNKTQRCTCFTANGIIECSPGQSSIKRGYWFGIVAARPTITICPINYCDFTCCDATDGFFQLSPQRIHQCRTHRSGSACGSCEEGYTLSFDSVDCVNIDNCTTGQTVLVVTLTMLYWVIVTVAVFAMMYYKVDIGYFYSVTYYYSLLDILLNQTFHLSDGLYTTVSIISSMVKLTPQFLGRLCLVKGISGIDQHFIHYVHPLVVSLIILAMWQFTKRSHRLSMFVSKNIIHFICFLLLLSYTSVAITSLLLMRSLAFFDVNKVYTYLSPDIEYFHGRHLPYAIVAVLCTIVIVIGLPLLLLLEPFLNCKINFVRIKPLLDQFQGCYKDKYRSFAAYYMICRLVIIIITITTSSDDFTSRYILITASTVIALLHLTVRPYNDKHLNTFDGFILNLMVLVTVIPIFEYFNNFSTNLVLALSFILLILPLPVIVLLGVTNRKEYCTKLIQSCTCFSSHCITFHKKTIEVSKDDTDRAVDDQMRENVRVTVCTIDNATADDEYRESFMEVMDDAQD